MLACSSPRKLLHNLYIAGFILIFELTGSHELLTAQIDPKHWPYRPDLSSQSQLQAPQFFSPSLKVIAQRGDRILLPCVVRDLGDDQILWRHGSNILAGSNFSTYSDDLGRIRLFQNFSLEISNITGTDDGVYECFLASPLHSLKLTHHVVVQDPPTVSVLPAKGVVVVNESESVQIGCIPHGNPKPRITWTKRDGQLPENVHKQFSQSVIIMERVSRKHTGLYACYADNGVGLPAIGAVYVRVLYTPEVEIPKRRVHGGKGYKTQLICIVHADPKPEVNWFLGQKPVTLSDRIFLEVRDVVHTLTISHVRESDFGTYMCTANNSFGYDLRHIELSGIPNAPVMTRWEALPESRYLSHSPGLNPSKPTSESTTTTPGDTLSLRIEPSGFPGGVPKESGDNTDNSTDSPDFDVHVQLLWAVECYSSLIDYRLSFRPAPEKPVTALNEDRSPGWTELTIPADPSSAFLHTKSFVLHGLQRDKIYEAVIKARNKYGWSPISSVCYFSTFANSTSADDPSVKEFYSKLDSLRDVELRDGTYYNGSIFYARDKEYANYSSLNSSAGADPCNHCINGRLNLLYSLQVLFFVWLLRF